MNSIFAKLLYEMEKSHDTVLVSIVSEAGSAPRGVGSQMLVGSKGRITGSIGGGAVEKRSEELALSLLKEKRSLRHDFTLRQGVPEDIGMVCGGDVSVWFQYISGTDEVWSTLARRVLQWIAQRKPGQLALNLSGGAPALLEPEQTLSGAYCCLPLPLGERAILFGGGHCAQALVPLLASVGFRVTVMDCRPEYVTKELHPAAEELICGDFTQVENYLQLQESDYIVIMTNGHSHDLDVEAQVLRKSTTYVGVIGSRSKIAAVNARLRDMGIEQERLDAIHTPIGLSIKAVTPAEIAVSIAAEMILVRATLRERSGIPVKGCPMH